MGLGLVNVKNILLTYFKRFPDFFPVFILTLTLPLFFYKLGQSSLVSWDEAWHSDIARHVASSGNIFNLVYNGSPFTDHPPGGYWLTAINFRLFGISEFTARLSSALTGFLSLILVYLLAKKLFNRIVGLSAAISFSSAFWFLSRARTGNLDIPLVFFFLLTIYTAFKASENKKFFILFNVSLAFLIIIKSLLPLAIIPSLALIFWKSKLYKIRDYLISVFSVLFLWGTWTLIQLIQDPSLVDWNITHSLRGASFNNNFVNSFNLLTTYLHNGIGKWFWPGILGLTLSLFLGEKKLFVLILFFVSYSIPFIFSKEVQIWHLIPLYPILILAFYGSAWVTIEKFIQKFKFFRKIKFLNALLLLSFLSIASYFSFLQIKTAWYQFIDIPAYVSDEAILSREAGKYPDPIFIDGDFDPAATFYAGRPVKKLYDPDIINLFKKEHSFLLITNQWRLEKTKINPSLFSVIKIDRDKVLIRKF